MTGSPGQGGLLPRALAMIFNSIGPYQAKRFVSAMGDIVHLLWFHSVCVCKYVSDLLRRFSRRMTKMGWRCKVRSMPCWSARGVTTRRRRFLKHRLPGENKLMLIICFHCVCLCSTLRFIIPNVSFSWRQKVDPEFSDMLKPEEASTSDAADEDSSYSVFVSYIEIYNNYIYDLLEENQEDAIKPKYVWEEEKWLSGKRTGPFLWSSISEHLEDGCVFAFTRWNGGGTPMRQNTDFMYVYSEHIQCAPAWGSLKHWRFLTLKPLGIFRRNVWPEEKQHITVSRFVLCILKFKSTSPPVLMAVPQFVNAAL